MGLNISVYKVTPVAKEDAQDINNFYALKDFKELTPIFKNLAFAKVNEYYNVIKVIEDMGFTSKQLECTGMSFDKNANWDFLNKEHPLYKAYKWLDKAWSKTYFDKISELQTSPHYKNFEKNFKNLLVENGWKEKYRFYVNGQKKYQYNLVNAWKFCRESIGVVVKNPPTFTRKEKCLAIEEVGYQRKGANSQFYEDNMWDSKCIADLKTLKKHWGKYFSKPTPDSEGGFGSGVEYDLTAKEMRMRFKKNIIDNFVEGETFVIYH